MSPLTLTTLLFVAETLAVGVTLRNGTWRVVPGWVVYGAIAAIHVATGTVAQLQGIGYPIALLYFEPAFILVQIAFTFETAVRFLGVRLTAGAPENRLLVWLVPLVPAAILLPIEIGFLQDALSNWNSQRSDALMLVYGVRRFLSITLFVLLASIPIVTKLTRKMPRPAVAVHHYIATAYMAFGALGYGFKPRTKGSIDYYLTMICFVIGPALCFLIWSWRMWNASPADFERIESASSLEGVSSARTTSAFERRLGVS